MHLRRKPTQRHYARETKQKGALSERLAYLSHARSAQLATSQRESMTTSSTVPGQMVISVLRTKRVLKLIRLRDPILREDASVNSRLCSSSTLQNTQQYTNNTICSNNYKQLSYRRITGTES